MEQKQKQTKSKERVRQHGEVFTAEREVKAMCDLVKDETERIDSRFLEPACGDGNFLAEILMRKLAVVKRKYGRSYLDYKRTPCLRHPLYMVLIFYLTTCLLAASVCLQYGTKSTKRFAKRIATTKHAKQ